MELRRIGIHLLKLLEGKISGSKLTNSPRTGSRLSESLSGSLELCNWSNYEKFRAKVLKEENQLTRKDISKVRESTGRKQNLVLIADGADEPHQVLFCQGISLHYTFPITSLDGIVNAQTQFASVFWAWVLFFVGCTDGMAFIPKEIRKGCGWIKLIRVIAHWLSFNP